MNIRFASHVFLIVLSSLIPLVWILNPNTSIYTLQLCGVLTILYIVSKKVLPTLNHNFNQNILTILTTNSIVQLLVLSTGGTKSSFFFLYYFLIFAFAIIYESRQAFVVSLVTIALYLFNPSHIFDTTAIISLFSLVLISPLAQLLSNAMIQNLQATGKIKVLEDNIQKEEVDSLLWLSTEAKPTLNSVISSITDIVIFLNSTRNEYGLSKKFIDKIKGIQTDLITLYSSSEDLEESIKESTDKNNI